MPSIALAEVFRMEIIRFGTMPADDKVWAVDKGMLLPLIINFVQDKFRSRSRDSTRDVTVDSGSG